MKTKVSGDLLNYDGLVYSPVNELGVVFLFGKLHKELGFEITIIKSAFPDCIARRKLTDNKWEEVRIEFEYESLNFELHKHKTNECDIVVCWKDNWKKRPSNLEVIELKNVLWRLQNKLPIGPSVNKEINDIILELKREKRSPLDQAIIFKKALVTFKVTQRQLAKLLHVSSGTVSIYLKLLRLPENIQNDIRESKTIVWDAYRMLMIDEDYIQEAYKLYQEGTKVDDLLNKYPRAKRSKWTRKSEIFNK
jgi:predicted transcriptional regulator